jgi:hypothetical protein
MWFWNILGWVLGVWVIYSFAVAALKTVFMNTMRGIGRLLRLFRQLHQFSRRMVLQ